MQSRPIRNKRSAIRTINDRGAERRDLALLVVTAFTVRVLFCVVIYPAVAAQFGPGDDYDVIARNLAAGAGYVVDSVSAVADRLPLYPALLAVSFRLFGDVAWPWQLAQCLAGAATCGVVFTLARRYADRRGALAAGWLCAVHPTLILYSARPLTETLYAFLLILFVRALARPNWNGAAVGTLLGLQLLIKSTAVLDVGALLPSLRPRRFGEVTLVILCTVALLAPWAVWNLATTGRAHLLTATDGRALYDGLYISRHVGWLTPAGDLNRDAELALRDELAAVGVPPSAGVAQRDRLAGVLARAWIDTHRAEAARLWTRNLLLTWYLGRSRISMLVHGVLHTLLLLAAAVGAVRLWRGPPAARQLVAVAGLLVVIYTAFHAVVHPAVRYVLPVVPVAAVLAAGGFRSRRASL